MSATYNWAYKPGYINSRNGGLIPSVPAGADNVKPSGWSYVALFGNDTSGNGSRQYPYRTLSKAMNLVNDFVVVASGVYRESTINRGAWIIGDGDVILDGTQTGSAATPNLFNVTLRNYVNSFSTFKVNMFDVKIDNCVNCFTGVSNSTNTVWKNVVFSNCTGSMLFGAPLTQVIGAFNGCTFYNVQNQGIVGTDLVGASINMVFHSCNIWFQNASCITYSLFYNCKFAFGGTQPTAPPTGFTSYSSLAALQAAHLAAFPSAVANFPNCIVSDPLFNNPSIRDFSLQFGSPAKNLSYFGTYVGAKSIAYPIKASATEATGGLDFSTNVNLVIADDSITLSNPAIPGEIRTKLIVNPSGRQISKLPIYGFNADRNGQYIDSITDLDTVYKNAGDTLTTPTPYLVETGALTYNGNVYQPGDRLTTVSTATLFTTTAAGTLREILEAPQRHTIMARFSDSTTTIPVGTGVTVGYWYYVQSGSVTYNGTVYSAGQSFKGVDTSAFSGTGVVIVALSTESYQHYEAGNQPTSNNTGDTRTGSIIRGNGDPAYVRGGMGVTEFPINARFIQIRYIIKANNLKP